MTATLYPQFHLPYTSRPTYPIPTLYLTSGKTNPAKACFISFNALKKALSDELQLAAVARGISEEFGFEVEMVTFSNSVQIPHCTFITNHGQLCRPIHFAYPLVIFNLPYTIFNLP